MFASQEEENAQTAKHVGAAAKSDSKRAKKARQKQKSAAAAIVAVASAQATVKLHKPELSGAATVPSSTEPASSGDAQAAAQQQSTAAAPQAASTANEVKLPCAGAEGTGASDVDAELDAASQAAASLPEWMVCSLTGVRAADTLGLFLVGRHLFVAASSLSVALGTV